jgi:hypothetical protein
MNATTTRTLRRILKTLVAVTAVATASLGAAACSGGAADAQSSEDAVTTRPKAVVLSDVQRAQVVEKKATCPFVGTALAIKKLFTFGSPQNLLAPITGAGSVAELGDTGGGNLGTGVLTLFARGNHHFMRGPSGELDTTVPNNTFSLDLPGSQGSHPGHSGILQGDPTKLDSGRFSAKDFQRLTALKSTDSGCTTGHAEQLANGDVVIRRSEIGRFIAENLRADASSKVIGPSVFKKVGIDVVDFASVAAAALKEHARNAATGGTSTVEEDKLFLAVTKLLGEDNLIGSSGEFGLLMAFLANSPKTIELDGEPALSVDDLTPMFATPEGGTAGDRRFPDGWETWKKTRFDWVVSTALLMHAAWGAYHDDTSACP